MVITSRTNEFVKLIDHLGVAGWNQYFHANPHIRRVLVTNTLEELYEEMRRHVDLRFEKILLEEKKWDEIILEGAQFRHAKIVASSFRYAILSESNFKYAEILDCDFSRSRLSGATIENSQFRNCCFRSADLYGVWVHDVKFINCVLHPTHPWFFPAQGAGEVHPEDIIITDS